MNFSKRMGTKEVLLDILPLTHYNTLPSIVHQSPTLHSSPAQILIHTTLCKLSVRTHIYITTEERKNS